MVPAAFQQLYDDAERCLKRAIEVSNRVFSEVVIIFFIYRYTGTGTGTYLLLWC